jgi:hypothetical protein
MESIDKKNKEKKIISFINIECINVYITTINFVFVLE